MTSKGSIPLRATLKRLFGVSFYAHSFFLTDELVFLALYGVLVI